LRPKAIKSYLYTRVKKKRGWAKCGIVAACLSIAIIFSVFFPFASDNTFAIKAFAMDVTEDGTIAYIETDFVTHSETWGGFFDGEFFYLNVGLGYDGTNIESVEFVIENGVFATQIKEVNSQNKYTPKVYIGTDNQLIVNGTDFTPIGNTVVMDTPVNEDNLLFFAIPVTGDTIVPSEVKIKATATFYDGSQKVLDKAIDFSGIGVFIWEMDEQTRKEFEDLTKNSSNSTYFNPVN